MDMPSGKTTLELQEEKERNALPNSDFVGLALNFALWLVVMVAIGSCAGS